MIIIERCTGVSKLTKLVSIQLSHRLHTVSKTVFSRQCRLQIKTQGRIRVCYTENMLCSCWLQFGYSHGRLHYQRQPIVHSSSSLWYSVRGGGGASWSGTAFNQLAASGRKFLNLQTKKRILIERFGRFKLKKLVNSYLKYDYLQFFHLFSI